MCSLVRLSEADTRLLCPLNPVNTGSPDAYVATLKQHGRGTKKNPRRIAPSGVFTFKSLAVTYSCMAKGHTTIGAERFHFRVRKGIGWFPLAMAARQTGSCTALARGHRIRIGV